MESDTIDKEFPDYDQLVEWIRTAPLTFRGALLHEAVRACIEGPFFRDDAALEAFVRRSIADARK